MKKTKIGKNNTAQIKALIEAAAPKVSELKYNTGEYELIVKVYPVLPFTKRMQMIREIVDGVFMDKKDTIHTYAPEFLSLLKKYAIIKYFTDLDLPNKLDDMWLVLNYTTIYNDVAKIIGEDDVLDIFRAAENGINAYKEYLVTKTDTNSFMSNITDAIGNLGTSMPQLDAEEVSEALKNLPQNSQLQSLMSALFGDLNKEKDA